MERYQTKSQEAVPAVAVAQVLAPETRSVPVGLWVPAEVIEPASPEIASLTVAFTQVPAAFVQPVGQAPKPLLDEVVEQLQAVVGPEPSRPTVRFTLVVRPPRSAASTV